MGRPSRKMPLDIWPWLILSLSVLLPLPLFLCYVFIPGFPAPLAVAALLFFLALAALSLFLLSKNAKRRREAIQMILNTDIESIRLYTDAQRDQNPEAHALILHLKKLMNLEDPLAMLSKQMDFATLQSQINPHFLYNTLESIRGEALIHDQRDIASMVAALSAFFRYSISTGRNLVTLGDELKNLRSYYQILQYRFGERFRLKMDYDPLEPGILEYMLPKLTLQPLVENAVLHGLEQSISGGLVIVRITITRARLIVQVIDDGAGIESERLHALNARLRAGLSRPFDPNEEKHEGIAIYNVNQRIKIIFGEEHGLILASIQGAGTMAEVTLPRKTKSDGNAKELGHHAK